MFNNRQNADTTGVNSQGYDRSRDKELHYSKRNQLTTPEGLHQKGNYNFQQNILCSVEKIELIGGGELFMKLKSIRNEVPNKILVAVSILGFLVGVAVGYAIWGLPTVVGAGDEVELPKYICHATPPDTARNGWVVNTPADIGQLRGHVKNDEKDIVPPFGDFLGFNWNDRTRAVWENNCVRPTPTKPPSPTPTPENSISINRSTLECGTNHVAWTGDYFYKWDGDHYVKFWVNGRDSEAKWDEGEWKTHDLTLAPDDYKIRAELWGYWQEEWTLKASQDGHFTIDECEVPTPSPTPTPTPTPTPQPEEHPSDPSAPQCTATAPVLLPGNPLVWRLGDTAIVQWQPTEGNSVHIYYYQNQDPDNKHAVRDEVNDGYVEIGSLSGLDWTFGIQQANDCAGGEIVWIVDGATDGWVLFTP